MCGTQDVITKGQVDKTGQMLCGMTRRARRETEIKKTTVKGWDYWHHKQCKGNETEVKTVLKDYWKGNDEDSRSKYSICENEYLKWQWF